MSVNVCFLLNQPKYVPVASLLRYTCPYPFKIYVTNFCFPSENTSKRWKKWKPCFFKKDFQTLNNTFGSDIEIIDSVEQLTSCLEHVDVCLSAPTEYYMLSPSRFPCPRLVALSFNRCGFNHLMDVIHLYKDKLHVCMHSDMWYDKSVCGHYRLVGIMDEAYAFIQDHKYLFYGIDFMAHYYTLMNQMSKDDFRNEFNLPTDLPIALFSLRQAQRTMTIHRSKGHFIENCKNLLKELKQKGYYIVSRRRLGQHDVRYYNYHRSSEYLGFNEFTPFVDQEINGFGGFPCTVWRLMYASDLLVLGDLDTFASLEGLLCRKPMVMCHPSYGRSKRTFRHCSPILRQMMDEKIIRFLEDERVPQETIEHFVSKWYNTDVRAFWERTVQGIE